MREVGKRIVPLLVVIVILALILILFSVRPATEPRPAAPVSSSQTLPQPTPPSQAVLQQLAQSPAFQYLVSYTDKGFQPNTLKIKQGQTVRFTNNSSQDLWVASIGDGADQIYPGTSTCGGSTFDSCATLQPGDFWEFTFNSVGTWSFQNNVDKTYSGIVTVTNQ